jgi:outer membrane protein
MKNIPKFIAALFLFTLAAFNANAQKFAFVDTEYMLGKMPEYNSAQKKLDDMSADWQKEIEKRLAEIEKAYKDYQTEQVVLTQEQQQKKQQEIVDKEKALKEYQKSKFGQGGELEKKRQELIKPLQDKIFDAVQKTAKLRGFDFIFDKNGEMVMLVANVKYDLSDDVLESMGYTIDESKEKTPKK